MARVVRTWLLLVLAVVLVGCDGSSTTTAPSPAGTDVAAILEAREAYVEPASALGTSARALVVAVRALRIEVPDSAPDGTPDVDAREFLLEQARDAVEELGTLADQPDPLAGRQFDEPAVDAARVAWELAVSAASDAATAAASEVEVAADLLEAESRLAATAALWDERGSRAEQTRRLDEAADEAEAFAASLADAVDVPACSTAMARRVAAAQLVAERTRELHGHVARGQGRAFDEARAEFDQAPWHDGLVVLDRSEGACWERSSPVVAGAEAVIAALDDLVAALNTGVEPSSPGRADGTDLPEDRSSSG